MAILRAGRPKGLGGRWRPRRYTSPVVPPATLAARFGSASPAAARRAGWIGLAAALVSLTVAARPARGDAVHDLGDAFRAYDAGDLAAARAKLAGVDDTG